MIPEKIKPLVENLIHVTINNAAISKFVDENIEIKITPELSWYDHLIDDFSWEEKINFIGLFSAQAFCFQPKHGEKKWRY